MQNILYVAEKANAGADIARVLGLTGKTKDGFFTGDFADKRIIVAWASGHYITLKEPKDIDEKFAKWNIEDLPITFDLRSGLKVIPGKEKAFNTLADYLQGADLIVNCGDAGREGELIQRWIYKMAGVGSKPVKRLWTSSLTDKGIREANNNLYDSSEYDDLYAAGETRAVMDAFLGFNYSRALSLLKTDGVTIAYGRCQTPLLRAIVDRDKEIESFSPEPFAYIVATMILDGRAFTAVLSDQKDRSRIEFKDKSDAERIMTKLTGQLSVSDIRLERKRTNPPKPFSTLKLQKEMDKKHKIPSAKTDKILQSLYDEHKMITYPRTDSEYLPAAMKETVRNILDRLMFGEYEKYIRVAALEEIPARYFKEETGEHHALLPEDDGDIETKYRKLSDEEKLVFDAIVRRFISLFYPPNIYEKTAVDLMDQEHLFIAKGKKEIDEGFRVLYKGKHDRDDEDEEEEAANLPDVSAGERLPAEYELKEDTTKPKKDIQKAVFSLSWI